MLTIGAGTTWLEVERHPDVLEHFRPLAAAAREIGALQIQARGTLGGNVGTSSPVGDSLPVLLALDAELELASVRGHRRVPYREFCTGYRKTAARRRRADRRRAPAVASARGAHRVAQGRHAARAVDLEGDGRGGDLPSTAAS